ncbi:uncharacterized protein LOC104581623 [Brachypodium distachyon]|uniref:Replication protein A OB domain-containing protein n=1 Tax=Brachypodium distachyon TaxID=15368 RepID=A0A0Q3H8D8_BRADI|nr:uncharacterized protein LOC104581623 [Brachypodium distachyon]KQK19191.1 hypothetical protein BRADI_1g46873v3 [Brachypodium distachyon]PNT76304.1 hypothetical protein BRADI_1g46873v3 [Brachypodium distachyon]PNT76305.1 hypothetical protein BRADI_1g46873v3 [Brachypodium distachyon]|eukprot:XP_010227920.1 uncharacterized protein LOC104581623 [Brachypodium distachyon]
MGSAPAATERRPCLPWAQPRPPRPRRPRSQPRPPPSAVCEDLIGFISYVGPYDYASPASQYKLRNIHIRNQDEQTQEINLWGEDGETFDESAVLSKSDGKIVVCVFAGLTVGKYLGKFSGNYDFYCIITLLVNPRHLMELLL